MGELAPPAAAREARARVARPSPPLHRLPLLAAAVVALSAGLWAGLLRLGLDLPPLRPTLASLHGPLLVLGFLGTQIGLERAVALRRRWPYLAPAAAASGALWLLVGLPARAGQTLMALAGVALVGVFLAVHRIQPSWHNTIMGLGAVAWAVGALAWLDGVAVARAMPWLAAFLVLTIVGERLELARMRRLTPLARRLLIGAVALFAAGVALSLSWPGLGVRLAGAGLLAQAAWLARYDVARRTIRMPGAARYMAVALIAGYAWLALAGVVWMTAGAPTGGGFAYDAMVHTVFLGFVFSMVFAHAPVIVPAVLGVALPYSRVFYGPLALLHAGLVVRLVGDLTDDVRAWRWGGVLDELAIVAFLALAALSAMTSEPRATRRRARRRRP